MFKLLKSLISLSLLMHVSVNMLIGSDYGMDIDQGSIDFILDPIEDISSENQLSLLLNKAAFLGENGLIARLIAYGANINGTAEAQSFIMANYNGNGDRLRLKPLACAIIGNQEETVTLILSMSDIDLNKASQYNSAIEIAIIQGSLNLVRILFNATEDITKDADFYKDCLYLCNDLDLFLFLILKIPADKNYIFEDIIKYVTENEDKFFFEKIKIILEIRQFTTYDITNILPGVFNAISVSDVDESESIEFKNKYSKIVSLLIEYGADLFFKSNDHTIFYHLTRFGVNYSWFPAYSLEVLINAIKPNIKVIDIVKLDEDLEEIEKIIAVKSWDYEWLEKSYNEESDLIRSKYLIEDMYRFLIHEGLSAQRKQSMNLNQ